MDATTKISKITALVAELSTKSPHYDYEFEINATLDICVDSFERLLECEKSCPATSSSTLTDEEIETHNAIIRDLTGGVKVSTGGVKVSLLNNVVYMCGDKPESEGEETQPEQWELKDLTPNVVEEEEEDFEYDDKGVKVRWNKETEGWDALEPYCFECGRPEGDCEVSTFTIENEVFICCECAEKAEGGPYCDKCGRLDYLCEICEEYSNDTMKKEEE